MVTEVRRPLSTAGAVVDNPMRKLSILMLLVFLYIGFSRLLEVVYIPSLALVLAILALMGAILGGDMASAVRSNIGLCLLGFTIWACATVPFSVWPGGSVTVLKDTWFKTAIVFFIIGAVLLTAAECRRGFLTMAAAAATIVLLSFKFANMSTGRLSFGYGTLANPNDFAAYLLVGAPFCVYALLRAGMFMRVVWAGILLLLLMQFLKTGSRGGMIALAVLVVYLFWKSPVGLKLAMMLVLCIGVAAAPLVLPRSVVERYATLLGDSEDAESRQAEFAESSTESRTMLFKMSLLLTARNPILGVGIGQFGPAVADTRKAEGLRAIYQQTHNMYSQLSSETGIPGLLLYMAAVWHALSGLRLVRRVMTGVNQDLVMMANCLHVSWILFLSAAMFASVAYHLQISLLLGFSYALRTAALSQLANRRVAARPTAARTGFGIPQPALR